MKGLGEGYTLQWMDKVKGDRSRRGLHPAVDGQALGARPRRRLHPAVDG